MWQNTTSKIHYKYHKQNVKADTLSRIPWHTEEDMVTIDQLNIQAIIDMDMMGQTILPEACIGDGEMLLENGNPSMGSGASQ